MKPETNIKRTPEEKAFIRKNAHLFWYIPDDKKEDISDEVLVEFILNYGTMQSFQELRELLGLNRISTVFLNLEGRKKMNFYPEIYNLFYLYLKKNVQGDSE